MKRTTGVCYYPEHWPEEVWADDAQSMVAAGLTWVRIGEFAWSRLEPSPAGLEFEWLDRAIEVLGAAGLRVVLGTPTATPPRWMIDRHPDMLAVDASGAPRTFGSRRHYCFSHLGYRQESVRITRLLAERYGANPHVAAWQTDNEYGCHDTTLSYSAAARAGFQDWLAQKYQSPEALNRAWGNVFWSMEYADFAEVDLPNLTVTEPNPAHVLDFRRYSSDQVVAFNKAQADVIRQHTDAPIAHNYMGAITDFDHYAVGADLDIASWDSYPLGFSFDRITNTETQRLAQLRQGDPDFQAFHHDLYRTVGKGRLWIMEQQPGPVNWASFNPAPLPGMVRLWSWEAFAHGAETVCYFRWRQAPFAQEQMHAGLLMPDRAPAPALAEARQVADEIEALPQVGTASAKVALIFDYTSAWAWDIQPQGAGFTHFDIVFAFYRGLRRLGLSVDILPPDTGDLTGYDLLVAPGLFTLGDGLKEALGSFGGIALLGPRSGSKTPDFSIPDPMGPDLPGLDLKVTRVESLPPGAVAPLEGGGAFCHWVEEVAGSAEVLRRRQDGAPALLGSGRLRYLTGWPDAEAMQVLLSQLTREAGLATHDLPGALRLRDTDTHRFWFNYGTEPVEHDGREIAPAGVAWEAL